MAVSRHGRWRTHRPRCSGYVWWHGEWNSLLRCLLRGVFVARVEGCSRQRRVGSGFGEVVSLLEPARRPSSVMVIGRVRGGHQRTHAVRVVCVTAPASCPWRHRSPSPLRRQSRKTIWIGSSADPRKVSEDKRTIRQTYFTCGRLRCGFQRTRPVRVTFASSKSRTSSATKPKDDMDWFECE